jgi:hypothetical protein
LPGSDGGQPSAVSFQPEKTFNTLGFAERAFEPTADG